MENKDLDKTISLEASFNKLDEIINELEGEDVTLERSFALYKEGIELVENCQSEIDMVEKKVLELGKNGEISEFQ
ncbi:MAG: exodeoxyribonuclease VII small subunit [Lachnospiraceae bacterium]|nr:exodeoxyribonuclease VII small subunit [Lachnospiraceae bacterium]